MAGRSTARRTREDLTQLSMMLQEFIRIPSRMAVYGAPLSGCWLMCVLCAGLLGHAQTQSNCVNLNQFRGEEVLVSHLQPVTISPPEGTCGQDPANSVIGQYFDSPTIFNNFEMNQYGTPDYYGYDGSRFPQQDFPVNEDFRPQSCGVEEHVCPERHPRDQNMVLDLPARQVIGGPLCSTDTTGTPSTMSFNIGRNIPFRRRRRAAADTTALPLCDIQVGENIYGTTENSTFVFRFLVKRNSHFQAYSPNGEFGRQLLIDITDNEIRVGFVEDSPVQVDMLRTGVWYHLALQLGYNNTGFFHQHWMSVFLDGIYLGSSVFTREYELAEDWRLLPLSIGRVDIDSPSLNIEGVRVYNKTLTNREISELYSGEFPKLDVFSDCLCPGTHPMAIADPDRLDLYCMQNHQPNVRIRRDNPSGETGLYITEFLTDGMVLPLEEDVTPFPLYTAWASTPRVDPVTITVQLREVTEVSQIRLVSLTPPPDGDITLTAGQNGEWRPFFMFLDAVFSSGQTGVPSGSFRFDSPLPPYILHWDLRASGVQEPILMDSLRITISGSPRWSLAIVPQARKRRQASLQDWGHYHMLSEIEVFGRSPGCACYGPGTAVSGALCRSMDQCACRSDLDQQLSGPECRPYVTSISPLFGPESGGTVITIQGKLLSEVFNVFVGNQSCGIRQRSDSHLTCRVAEHPYPLMMQPINGYRVDIIDLCSVVLGPEFNFQYRPDPVVQDITPRQSFLSGGIIQTVSGTNLDSVANPYMIVYLLNGSQKRRRKRQANTYDYFLVEIDDSLTDVEEDAALYAILTSLCEVVSATEMHCPIPPIAPPDGFSFPQAPIDGSGAPQVDVAAYVGFWLDGVEEYRDMRDVDEDVARIFIYYNPELHDFSEPQRIRAFKAYPPHNHDDIEIMGNRMMSGCNMTDYKVSVGDVECSVYYLDATTMYCKAPSDEPQDADSIHDAPRVKVTVGYLYEQYTIGYLDYQSLWQSTEFYIGIGVAAAVILIIVIVSIICCIARK